MVIVLFAALAGCGGDEKPAAREVPVSNNPVVKTKGTSFEPSTIKIDAGTAVTWRFDDGALHNVVGDSFESPTKSDGVYKRRFERAGEYEFRCTLHPGMDGTVIVQAG